jgi:hypothetical protein
LAASELNRAIPLYQSGPVDRLGRGHWEEDGGVEPRDLLGPPRVFKARCPLPRRRRTFQSGARRCRSLRCYPPPAFGAGCSAGCARSMSYCAMNHLAQASLSSTRCPDGCGRGWQRTENSNPSAFAPTRFPARASRLAGSSSKRGRRAIRKPRGYPRIR